MICKRPCTIVVLLVLALAAGGCAIHLGEPAVQGSGVAKTEKRNVAQFERIDVNGAVEVEYKAGPASPVEVTTDDNLLALVITEIQGDTLHLYTKGNTSSRLGIKIKLSAPALKELKVNGASRGTLTGLAGKEVRLEANGAGQITATGKADRLEIECSGASHVQAAKMPARSVTVSANGASTAEVHADEELHATASGASTIRYTGSPAKVQRDVSGASHVSQQ
ncbi:MAG TPA: head GIN domain-containing protein [Gemmataceae bacterium]|nr:head GIN domain-containing protein [Gemmataceae bacterium]